MVGSGSTVPERDATPETLLGLMKSNGVSKTVLIQVIHYRYGQPLSGAHAEAVSEEVQGCVPGRSASTRSARPPVAAHRARIPRGSAVAGGGPSGRLIAGALMPPLWKRCSELKVPMTVLAPVTRMPEIAKLMEKLPEMTLVIDHMADCPVDQPQELEKLIALKRFPNVFVKISHTWSLSRQPYPWLDSQELVKRLYAAFGPQRD